MFEKVRRTGIILSLISFSFLPVIANEAVNNELYRVQMNYYNSLKTCQAGTFSLPTTEIFGIKNDTVYEIKGNKNGKCEFREISKSKMNTVYNVKNVKEITCLLPMDVARKFADESIRTLKEASETNSISYSSYVNQIYRDNTYCTTNDN